MAKQCVRGTYAPGEKHKKARPVESTEYFLNPHKAMVTFQHFHGDPPTPPPKVAGSSSPPATSADATAPTRTCLP